MAAPRWVQELATSLFLRDYSLKDITMVALAMVGIVATALANAPLFPDAIRPYAIWADRVIVGVFVIEYLVDLVRVRQRKAFVKATWYDLVGMIPFPFTVLRVFRLLRVPHVLVWGSRYPGERQEPYALRVIRQYEPVLIAELTDPLLLRLLKVLRDALGKGRYASQLGSALDERRERFHGVVLEGLRRNLALRAVLMMPGADDLVRETERQVFDVLVATLTDPELDDIVRESIDAPLRDLELRLRVKEQRTGAEAAEAAAEPREVPVGG